MKPKQKAAPLDQVHPDNQQKSSPRPEERRMSRLMPLDQVGSNQNIAQFKKVIDEIHNTGDARAERLSVTANSIGDRLGLTQRGKRIQKHELTLFDISTKFDEQLLQQIVNNKLAGIREQLNAWLVSLRVDVRGAVAAGASARYVDLSTIIHERTETFGALMRKKRQLADDFADFPEMHNQLVTSMNAEIVSFGTWLASMLERFLDAINDTLEQSGYQAIESR